MLTISADDIDRLTDYPALIDAIGAAFRGDFEVPLRHHHTIERPGEAEATFLLMPAWTAMTGEQAPARPYVGLKAVTIYPDNPARGEPTVLGMYLLLDGATGKPLALIDGPELTVRRTAAASALAARYLAREDAGRMVMVGAGAMAPCLIRAHAAVRPVREIALWNRNAEKARALAASLRDEGLAVTATDDLETAVREADIVSCATISATPIVLGAWLKPGTHVDLVGAFRPDLRETDDEVMRRGRVFVDTRPGGFAEAGDVVQALQSGALREQDVAADLFELASGSKGGRRSADDITVFKSVGTAIEDLAAAILLYEASGA